MGNWKAPHLEKREWLYYLRTGGVAIDATCGNGKDTLSLCQMGAQKVFALDIQQKALDATRQLLQEHQFLDRLFCHLLSHAHLSSLLLPKKPSLIVYNLGYLPGGDKTITTKVGSTLQSLSQALDIIDVEGAIFITCYPGHPEGKEEEEAILKFLSEQDSKRWMICHKRWINRPFSPSTLCISSKI